MRIFSPSSLNSLLKNDGRVANETPSFHVHQEHSSQLCYRSMGIFSFESHVKAARDMKEIEYIMALHQTGDLQNDKDAIISYKEGSISAIDIVSFLTSRYSIIVSEDVVKQDLLVGLSGSSSEGDVDCLDVVEIVAILLIPYLVGLNKEMETNEAANTTVSKKVDYRKSVLYSRDAMDKRKELDERHVEGEVLLGRILDEILSDTTGSDAKRPLTKELLKQIFLAYNEEDMAADDQLLSEMIDMVTSEDSEEGGNMLDVSTFYRGLVNDVKLYDTSNHSRISTHLEDVYGVAKPMSLCKKDGDASDLNIDGQNELDESQTKKFRRCWAYGLPQIDFLADTAMDSMRYMLSWLVVILFAGKLCFPETRNYFVRVCPEDKRASFGCRLADSFTHVFLLMVFSYLIMGPLVVCLSLGNNPYQTRPLWDVIGLALMSTLTSLAYFDKPAIAFNFMSTENVAMHDRTIKVLYLMSVICLLFYHILNIVRGFIPLRLVLHNKILAYFFRGSNANNEFNVKQAAQAKVHDLVENAFDLHEEYNENICKNRTSSTYSSRVSDKYYQQMEEREIKGGYFYCWKNTINGSLKNVEGIWFHSRIVIGNFLQVLLPIAAFAILINYGLGILHYFYPSGNISFNDGCHLEFNETQCLYPSLKDSYTGVAVCEVQVPDGCSFPIDSFETINSESLNRVCAMLDMFNISLVTDCRANMNGDVYIHKALNDGSFDEFTSAFVLGSTKSDYCGGHVSVCTPNQKWIDGTETWEYNMYECVLGLDVKIRAPFSFHGQKCRDTEVNYLLEQIQSIRSWYPSKETLNAAMYTSLMFSIIAATLNASLLIPSMTTTLMKFRNGHFESLRNSRWKEYRKNLLDCSFLLGLLMWGSVMSIFLISIFMFLLILLLSWHVTRNAVLEFLGIFILVILFRVGVRLLFVISVDKTFNGFYRTNPTSVNLVNIGNEAFNIIVTFMFVVTRVAKLLIVAFFFACRIETPLLADQFGALDRFPHIFKQELLCTDAHRHPWIERLGMIYLMKLKHGKEFANRAGLAWRMMFVFALMPYLRRRRIAGVLEDIEIDEKKKEGFSPLRKLNLKHRYSPKRDKQVDEKSELEKSSPSNDKNRSVEVDAEDHENDDIDKAVTGLDKSIVQ